MSRSDVHARSGDSVFIPGDYQFRALHEGSAVQRFWHYNKQLTIQRYLRPNPGEVVADIGCGSGVISNFLAECGAKVTGIDANEDAIRFARGHFTRPGVSFEVAQASELTSSERPWDKAYCLELIEHIYFRQADAMLRKIHDRLKPGGQLYLTTPNYRSMWPLLEWVMDKFCFSPKLAGHQHVVRYNRTLLGQLIENAGFTVEVMASTCLLAPWMAAINWNAAVRLNRVETGLGFGSILVCVARKRSI